MGFDSYVCFPISLPQIALKHVFGFEFYLLFYFEKMHFWKDEPRSYVNWNSNVPLLRICNFEQTLDSCFLRERLLFSASVFTGKAQLLLAIQTLHSQLH